MRNLEVDGKIYIETLRLRKGIKEDQIRAALRLKRDARLDKAKRTWTKGHNTPVK